MADSLYSISINKTADYFPIDYIINNTTVPYNIRIDFKSVISERICMKSVRQNGLMLQNLNRQTENICLEAGKQNEWTLSLVKTQTHRL